jgi:hypothetical protein
MIPVNAYPAHLRALAGMWPSQTPEKSGNPSAVFGTGCDAAGVCASAFGAVWALRLAEKVMVAARASV